MKGGALGGGGGGGGGQNREVKEGKEVDQEYKRTRRQKECWFQGSGRSGRGGRGALYRVSEGGGSLPVPAPTLKPRLLGFL